MHDRLLPVEGLVHSVNREPRSLYRMYLLTEVPICLGRDVVFCAWLVLELDTSDGGSSIEAVIDNKAHMTDVPHRILRVVFCKQHILGVIEVQLCLDQCVGVRKAGLIALIASCPIQESTVDIIMVKTNSNSGMEGRLLRCQL